MWEKLNFSKQYLDEMIEMTMDNYGKEETISHKTFVNHEYFQNPHGDAIVELAYDKANNALAGQYVINPHRFFINGKTCDSVLSLNTLTRKAYRGQGIFTGLAESAYDKAKNAGFGFCYGAPNPNSYPGFIKKLGFKTLCEMPLYLRPLKISKLVKERTNSFLGFLSYPFNLFCMAKKIKDQSIVLLTKDNYLMMNDFWKQISNKYSIIGVRDAEYVFYRYLNVPIREYYPYVYLKDNHPIAFAVFRIRTVAGMTAGMIADFVFVEGFEKEAKKLVSFLSKRIKQMGAGLAGCIMLSHSQEVKILKKTHFVKCPQKMLPQPTPLILRIFNEDLEKEGLLDIKNWFFTTGDYDVV